MEIVLEDTPPLEMITILEELKKKLASSTDLDPKEYLEKDVRAMYAIAHKHYCIDNYEDAEELFVRLVLARPANIAFWKGLASTRQMQKNYNGALVCYGMCAVLDNKDLSFHIYGAECLYYLEELEEAGRALAFVGETIKEDHPNFKAYAKVKLWVEGAKK